MSGSDNQRETPDLLVEQLALGEIDEPRATQIRRALEREAADGGRDRLAELEASNREILADYPPERLAAEIRRRADAAQPGRRRATIWVLAPALAAAGLIVWVVTRDEDPTNLARVETTTTGGAALVDDGEPETTRIKGGVEPYIVIDRKTAAGHERLAADDRVAAGDVLQLSYVGVGRRVGVIVSIDGAGVVTLHHPRDADGDPALGEGKEVPLPEAYELDAAPAFERFVFVTRDDGPVSVAEVLAAAERLAAEPDGARTQPLALPGEGWSQHSLVLRKPEPDTATPSPAQEKP